MDEETNLAIGLSVAACPPPPTMADCYDVDVGETDEPSTSGSAMPFQMVEAFGKVNNPSASLAMFYPQLAGYELHPFLLNPHHDRNQNDIDLGNNDKNRMNYDHNQSLIGPSSMMTDQVRQKYKEKQKLTRRRTNEFPGQLDSVNTSEYAVKNCKSFFCRACGKSFKFQTSLLRHNNKVHISKYQCPTCNRVFSRQAYLDVHTSKQGSSCFLGNYVASKSNRSKPK